MRWCIYHSHEWETLVETGWVTAFVEYYPVIPFGPIERVAIMLRKQERKYLWPSH
jgi:hypothetical protein